MANEPKLKVGVIGTGVLGKFHTNLYRTAPHADLVGIYDADPKVAADAAKQFNVQAFQDLDELVDRCEALTVAVPATLHGLYDSFAGVTYLFSLLVGFASVLLLMAYMRRIDKLREKLREN